MAKTLDYKTLLAAVSGAAAFRCRARLQPGGGDGDKVFPPTYAGAVYATEERRVPGYHEDDPAKTVPCVLLDSVQSQANRIEEALQDAIDEGRIELPVVEVGFDHLPILEPGDEGEGLYEPIGRVTSLEAPHRVADAILRDSETAADGTPFRQTEAGKKLDRAGIRNATPVYELCPTALLLGLWDSTGPKGGLGVKFQRALVSEIVGVNAVKGVKTASRIDPLAIQKGAATIFESADGGEGWTLDPAQAKQHKKKPVTIGKEGKPSEVNHGNVTPSLSENDRDGDPLAGGVTIDHAELVTVISLPALRRLRFPQDGEQTAERNAAARAVIAAIGLCGASLMTERGLDLRSRCLLVADATLEWELVPNAGAATAVSLDADAAVKLLADAVKAAETAGLTWLDEPLKLRPSAKLAKLLQQSQKLTVQSGADAEDS